MIAGLGLVQFIESRPPTTLWVFPLEQGATSVLRYTQANKSRPDLKLPAS